jgi:hypothetical protein
VVNGEDYEDGIDIGGNGTPGATGVITVGGVSQNVTVDGVGHWNASFTTDELPGGEYEEDVSIILTSGDSTVTATDVLVVDTIAQVSVAVDIVETDGTVSFAEESDGITLTGTTQPGSTVVVTVDGNDYNATVTGGTWSVDLESGTIAQGEYDLNVSVTATDGYGNTATTSDVVHIDTVTSVTVDTSAAGGNGMVNEVEHADGVSVNGLAEANASVVVTLGAVSQTVDADASGAWTATFASSDVPTGTLDLPVTAVSTDAVGNTATASGTVQIDTELSVGIDTSGVETDGVVNAAEHADGVTLSGTADAGAQVTVVFGTGTRVVTTQADGTWSADWTTSEVPTGETTATVSVQATDNAGNVATTSGTVAIDTAIDATVNTAGLATDGIVNGVEHADGIRLTGTAEGAETVSVNLGGVVHNANVNADGTWATNYGHDEFATGEVNVAVTVTSVDAAGNTDTASGTVVVDTFVNQLDNVGVVEGDDVVNINEASDGITLRGVVEEGSSVMVEFEGTTRSATVDAAGNWSVDFAASEIPGGTYDAVVNISATDAAGNVASITDTFTVDQDAPVTADIESVTTADTVTRGFSMLNVDDGTSVDVTEFVNGSDAAATDVAGGSYVNPLNGELQHLFESGAEVPDGSHLVVTTGDAAGNTNSTLVVLDEDGNSVVDMSSAAIGEFNIGAIDLEFADASELTLSTADLVSLSDNDNSLVVHGGTDDTLTLNGTATQTGTQSINGQDYNVYTVGEAELIVSQDIDFHQSVI